VHHCRGDPETQQYRQSRAIQGIHRPACSTISWSNVQKYTAILPGGGQVIATGTLPSKATEFGHDADVAI